MPCNTPHIIHHYCVPPLSSHLTSLLLKTIFYHFDHHLYLILINLKTYFDMVAKGPESPKGEAGVKQPHASVDGV